MHHDIALFEAAAALGSTPSRASLMVEAIELGDWAERVSLELRSSLGAISGFAQALERELQAAQSSRAHHYADRIGAAARRLGASLDGLDLLTWLDRASIASQEVDLASVASGILRKLQAGEPRRLVRLDVHPELRATGDLNLLKLLLEQLLANAWKFTRPQRATAISFAATRGRDGRPVYTVRDNGTGFDPAYAYKLFRPFQRLHSSAEFPGVGIGLACVRRIVERHGGRVWAESAEGQGAAFHFTLAASPPAHPGLRAATHA